MNFDIVTWKDVFTARELDEIYFNLIYKSQFNHGTDGHNARIIIAKFAELLEQMQERNKAKVVG